MDIATKPVAPQTGTPPTSLNDAASSVWVSQVAEAVNLQTLNAAQARGAAPAHAVLVQPPYYGPINVSQDFTDAWDVTGPAGEPVLTTGTTTQGLQEAITYAALLGVPLRVSGRAGRSTTVIGDSSTYPAAFFCSTPVVFPPMFMMDIDIDGANIIYTGALADAVVTVTSCMMVRLRMSGEIITDATATPPLLFRPLGNVPLDGSAAVITSSRFEFGSVGTGGVTAGSAASGIIFDCANGSIISNQFDFIEAECSIGQFPSAMLMRNAGSLAGSTVFSENTITFPNPHGFLGAGIAIGGGTVAGSFFGANYRNNIFILSSIRGGGPACVGVNCYGNGNTFICGLITGEAAGLLNGIVFTTNDANAGGNDNTVLSAAVRNNGGSDYVDTGLRNLANVNNVLRYNQGAWLAGSVQAETTAAGTTLTAANMTGDLTCYGIIVRSGPGGNFADTTDTAANIFTSMGTQRAQAGRFMMKVINTTAFVQTINAGLGVTLFGVNTIAANSSADFVGITNAAGTAINLCR